MTTLLLGASGQLGRALYPRLAAQGRLLATTRGGGDPADGASIALDVAEPDALTALLDASRPQRIVNATAWTDVDGAEREPAAAFAVNATAPAVVAAWCARNDATLVHYSTDYVFDGRGSRPYRPDDATAPLGAYGAGKAAGEQAIRASGARHLIFRTAWLYAAHGHNFLRTMLRLGRERDVLRVVADQTGTPTPAAFVADATADILQRSTLPSGTWHMTAAGQTSWHGFAEAIFEGAVRRGLLPRAPRVEAIGTADYPTPAARPAYSRLDTASLTRDFGITPPDWRAGLDAVLDGLVASAGEAQSQPDRSRV